ncbi:MULTISPECIES: hypothetical protein [unclassified Streptomyces]|uniref:hypothetical protein n=1 Tax=unclassified Streptomyces TaxID=2593676 RepID=UPI001DE708D4|nr:hypothetical protein [Streptomyces sp. MAG02]
MNEQDSESLDSLRESSALDLAIRTAESKLDLPGILRAYDLSEESFTNRFPALAKVAQGLPDLPDEKTAPPA